MSNVNKIKELIDNVNKTTFLLNEIGVRVQQLGISDQDVEQALKELKDANIIRIEDLRGAFWQLKIVKL